MAAKKSKASSTKLPKIPSLPRDTGRGGFLKAVAILNGVIGITVNLAKAAKDPSAITAAVKLIKK
jgi:hypothetical protein